MGVFGGGFGARGCRDCLPGGGGAAGPAAEAAGDDHVFFLSPKPLQIAPKLELGRPPVKANPPQNRTAPTVSPHGVPQWGVGPPRLHARPPTPPNWVKTQQKRGRVLGGGPQDARGGPNCPQSPPKSPLPPPRARFSFPERTPLSQVLLFSFGPQRNGQKKAKGAGGGTPCGTGFESPRRRCWPGPALLSRHGGRVATYGRCCGTKVLSYKDCIVT